MITSAAVVLGIDTDMPAIGYRLSRLEPLLEPHKDRAVACGPIDSQVVF